MRDYDKIAALRRARTETVLEYKKIQDKMFDTIKEYIENAAQKALADGTPFDADEVGKAAAVYSAEPWSLNAKPAIEHAPGTKSVAKRTRKG